MQLRESTLITVSGPDGPGITASLMRLLVDAGATIDDVEQVVVRRQLVLAVLATLPARRDANGSATPSAESTLPTRLAEWARGRDLDVRIEAVDARPTDRKLGVLVTVMAPQVTPAHFQAVAAAIGAEGGNLFRILRIARYPVHAYEITVMGAALGGLRRRLAAVAAELGIDIATQPEGIGRRAQRLVVMDVDSTLIQNEVIELLAAEAGCEERVRELTEAAMRGELDFEATLRKRVSLLKGLDTDDLRRALAKVELMPGARTFVRTLKRLGFKVAIVSGGFTYFTDALKADLQLDYAFANELEVADGFVTGNVVGTVVDRRRKADLLRHVADLEGIPLDQTVAIGDGANDLDMLEAADLGIAFNAKPVVRESADTSISVPYLDAVLFVLGVRRNEVEAADEADGLPIASDAERDPAVE